MAPTDMGITNKINVFIDVIMDLLNSTLLFSVNNLESIG